MQRMWLDCLELAQSLAEYWPEWGLPTAKRFLKMMLESTTAAEALQQHVPGERQVNLLEGG